MLKKLYGKSIQSQINVVPAISLEKNLFTKGALILTR